MNQYLNKSNVGASSLWGASFSLTVFWVANILKEAYPPVKSFFGFNAAVGPLLGLFLLSSLVFVAVTLLWQKTKLPNKFGDRTGVLVYIFATVIFFAMVFPPFFEPLVELISG